MRAVDLIRGILDLIDRDTPKVSVTTITSEPKGSEEDRRMNQISDLVTDPFTAPELANAPDVKVADIEAVMEYTAVLFALLSCLTYVRIITA